MYAARLAAALLAITLLLPATAAAQKASPELNQTDAEGDVRFGPSSPNPFPGTPSTQLTDYIDLLGLRVHDESVDGLSLTLHIKNIERPGTAFSQYGFTVTFRHDKTNYHLGWMPNGYYDLGTGNATPSLQPYLCILVTEDHCNSQRVIGTVNHETNELTAYIPKASLLGVDPVGESGSALETPIQLATGSILQDFVAESEGDLWSDRLPDTAAAGPYEMTQPSANSRVRIHTQLNETVEIDPYQYGYNPYGNVAGSNDFPRFGVEPGATSAIPLDIQNLNGAKRVINLTTEFADPKAASKWKLHIAPSIAIPGSDERTVNLLVNATSTAQHRDEALVRVIARSLGFPDEIGSVTLRLVANTPLSPQHPTLFLHAAVSKSSDPECTLPIPLGSTCTTEPYLNTLEEDPRATADETGTGTFYSMSINGIQETRAEYHFPLEEALPRDVVLDVTKPIEGTIRIQASAAFTGTMRVQLEASEVYLGGTEIAIPANQKDIAVNFIPQLDAQRIPAGNQMRLLVEIIYNFAGPGAADLATPPSILPSGSSLTLPVIPDRTQLAAPTRLGETFLSLRVRGDNDEFVNPGEARAFNLTLLNEGVDNETVTLNSTFEKGSCALELIPGDRYKLGPGESVRFGALIHAPPKAQENDQCVAHLQATSQADPTVAARVQLIVIVTNGLDLPNDARNYTADSEAQEKLDDGSGGGRSPAPAVPLLLVAALAAVAVHRRARRA